MKLPNREHAIVPIEKLSGYLLSVTHSVGRSKARYFRAIGFDERNMDVFERKLVDIACRNEIAEQKRSDYGVKYVIDGVLETPDGEAVSLRTVWIIETGQTIPRFVTAYPV